MTKATAVPITPSATTASTARTPGTECSAVATASGRVATAPTPHEIALETIAGVPA